MLRHSLEPVRESLAQFGGARPLPPRQIDLLSGVAGDVEEPLLEGRRFGREQSRRREGVRVVGAGGRWACGRLEALESFEALEEGVAGHDDRDGPDQRPDFSVRKLFEPFDDAFEFIVVILPR